MNAWDDVLARLQTVVDSEDFRRWFGSTSYASDSGDQIVVWVTTEPIRQHLLTHFSEKIGSALKAVGRRDTEVRFVVAGVSDDEDDEGE
jgi:chromosomal replication initiation ATPase DnaA